MTSPKYQSGESLEDGDYFTTIKLRERAKVAGQYRTLKWQAGRGKHTRVLETFRRGIPIWEQWLGDWNSTTTPQPAELPQSNDDGVLEVLDLLARLDSLLLLPTGVQTNTGNDLEFALHGAHGTFYNDGPLTLQDKVDLRKLYTPVDLSIVYNLMTGALPCFRRAVFIGVEVDDGDEFEVYSAYW
jgi:hypothetical protein